MSNGQTFKQSDIAKLMQPLTVLISLSAGVCIGIAIGMFLQSRQEIIEQKTKSPDMERLKNVKWERKEKTELCKFIKDQKEVYSDFITLYQIPMKNWVKAIGEDRDIVMKSIENIILDASVMNMKTGHLREVKIKSNNNHYAEIILVMKNMGIPVKTHID